MVICTGGMSVDPDDVTPTAIKESGGELVTYGSPVHITISIPSDKPF